MSEDTPKLGAYAPPPEEYDTFDARIEERDKPGPLLFIASIAFIILLIAAGYSLYKQGVREGGRNAAPRITADAEPYRELPADPGGVETPGQDIEAYNRRAGQGNRVESIDTASVRPGPEEPVETRPSLQVETASADEINANEPPARETTSRPAERPTERPEQQPSRTLDRQEPPQETPQPTARETLPQPEAPARQTPTPQPRQPEPTPAERPSTPAASTAGDYVVQIGAFRTMEEADQAWNRFTGRYGSFADGHGRDIETADLGERGIYHRLRIAGFETRDGATSYCNELKSAGQDCLVRSR